MILIVILIISFLLIYFKYSKIGGTEVHIWIQEGIGPFTNVSIGGKQISVLLDTGSLYLMSTKSDNQNCLNLTSNPQIYYYAGPSAQFDWISANVKLVSNQKSIDLGCIPVGNVPPSSAKAIGLPAVLGLAALPKWSTQRFKMQSLINSVGITEFWFILNKKEQLFVIGTADRNKSGKQIAKINIIPSLFSPTPGLGYLTTSITKLEVYFTPTYGYTIQRVNANKSLAQTSQFHYTLFDNEHKEPTEFLNITEWMCLFDTGTYPAIFYANGDVNLLGPRVAQSILPGQMSNSDFETAHEVIYTWGNQSLKANNVIVPKLEPSKFGKLSSLMTVCGFQFQSAHNIRYKINSETGLPSSVSFFESK